jgi:tungstate transport system substrate-binding protein
MVKSVFRIFSVIVVLISVASCSGAPSPAPTVVPAKPTAAPAAAAVSTAVPQPLVVPASVAVVSPTPVPAAPASPTSVASQPGLLMASTIGPIDAGIVDALESAYFKKTGVPIRHIGAGTGATIDMAKNGKFDIVLVHARALEDKFVADGFGVDRRDIMFNDFVILGPASDPAGIKGEKLAITAFQKLAQAKAKVVTRGDNSGTDVKEKEVWAKAGIKPAGDWYIVYEKGATGNAPTTRFADQQQAYVLMDRATLITLRKEIKLEVLVEKDEDLLNFISVIRVNPAKFPTINAGGAKAFQDWLVGEEAQAIIQKFGVDQYGEPLFFPNSDEWNKKNPKR